MNDLYVTCRRCGGWGSIETSQSEDGRFSYQDQCPECSSQGVVPASPADILAALPGVEKRWECYWAPMNYLKCDPFTKRHAPEFCGWRLIAPLSEEE